MTHPNELSRLREDLASAREKFTMHTAHVSAWLSVAASEFGVADGPANVQDVLTRIMDEAKRLRTALSRAEDSLTRAHVENAELREALGPFAAEAAKWKNIRNEQMKPICAKPDPDEYGDLDEASFTVGDLRRAANALASTSEGSPHK